MEGPRKGPLPFFVQGEIVKINTEIMKLNPAGAESFLSFSVHNRPISKAVVLRYKSDMENHRWKFTADPIRFNTEGELIDGQHRLTALSMIEDESFELEFSVVTGLDNESQRYMDQGKARTIGQHLALAGSKNTNAMAAGIRMYLRMRNGTLFSDTPMARASITKMEIMEWADDNPDLMKAINDIPFYTSLGVTPSICYAVAIEITVAAGPEMMKDFFRYLYDGGRKGSPTGTFNSKVRSLRNVHTYKYNVSYFAWMNQTFNAWVSGKDLNRLVHAQWHPGTFPRAYYSKEA